MEATHRYELEYSVVIPVKDEGQNVRSLAEEISKAMALISTSWESVWIDDGSTDNSLYELVRIHQNDSRHRYISLIRNYGQSAALAIGFSMARGDILITLDGDGQNDPKSIPFMVQRLKDDDADMVNGFRTNRRDTAVRRIASFVANAFRNWVTCEQVRDVGCSLRVFRHQCIENVPVFKGMHRFLPTLVRMRGYTNIVEMPVTHRPRKFGQTKYGIHNRLWVGLADTIAVRWMQSRMIFPEIKSSSSIQERGNNL